MIDFYATTKPEWTQETKVISSTVVTKDDWAFLTPQKDDNTITGVRVQCDQKFRYTLDGTPPTVDSDFYQMPDYPVDYHISTWNQMKLIRDGSLDAKVTVCPLEISK